MNQLKFFVSSLDRLQRDGLKIKSKIRLMCVFNKIKDLEDKKSIVKSLTNLRLPIQEEGDYLEIPRAVRPVLIDIIKVPGFIAADTLPAYKYMYEYEIYCIYCLETSISTVNISGNVTPSKCDQCKEHEQEYI